MSSYSRFSVLASLIFASSLQPLAAQPATPDQAETSQAQASQAVAQPTQKKPPEEPYIIEDGGFSIEPIYWLNNAQPNLRGGAAATTGFQNFDFTGNAKASFGGQVSVPAGKWNTLRISYFRVRGNANATASQDVTLFGQAYSADDYLAANYTLQNVKISWDYLSYTWNKAPGKIRLKTLYELQYTTISSNFSAPFKAVTTDADGNTNDNTANGSKNLIYPSLGVQLSQTIGHHFRWEVKGSGFALPHRATLWDAEGTLAARFGQVEVLAGEKAFHFKTSPQSEQYFTDTLSGAYAGVRYYWGRQ